MSMPRSRAAAMCGPRCRPRCSGWRPAPRAAPARCASLRLSHGADAGQQQRCDLRARRAGHGLDPFQVGVCAESVDAARTGQSVAVGDLDRIDSGGVQGACDRVHLLDAVLVADRVHAVAQGDVADVDVAGSCCGSGGFGAWVAMRSAVALAARGHDVEVSGVGGQVVRGAGNFEQHGDAGAGELAGFGDVRAGGRVEDASNCTPCLSRSPGT